MVTRDLNIVKNNVERRGVIKLRRVIAAAGKGDRRPLFQAAKSYGPSLTIRSSLNITLDLL